MPLLVVPLSGYFILSNRPGRIRTVTFLSPYGTKKHRNAVDKPRPGAYTVGRRECRWTVDPKANLQKCKQPPGLHPGGYFLRENHSMKIAVIPTRTSVYWNSEEYVTNSML